LALPSNTGILIKDLLLELKGELVIANYVVFSEGDLKIFT
jgi:hypothetical protein